MSILSATISGSICVFALGMPRGFPHVVIRAERSIEMLARHNETGQSNCGAENSEIYSDIYQGVACVGALDHLYRAQLLSSINVTPGVDMATVKTKVKRKSASRAADDELGTHALAIISFLYNRVIAGAAPALRKRTGLSVTEARIVFHLGTTSWATANKLAKNLGIDKAAISRATNRLVELGLITSERDPDHAARNILTLTETGEEHCRLIGHFTFAREKHLLNVLDDEEHRQFLMSLRKILTNVESVNKLVAQGHFWEE